MTSSSGTWFSSSDSKSSWLMGPVVGRDVLRRLGVGDEVRQHLVLDLDGAHGVFGRAFIHRGNADDLVARPEDFRSRLLHDLDGLHAGHLLGGAGIDALDAGMRVGAAHDLARQQPVGVVVVGVLGAAGGLGRAVDARDPLAEQRLGCRIRPRILAHDCLPPACASATARMPS